MRNESRFLFSHDHSPVVYKNLLGGSVSARIHSIGSNVFVSNQIHDYVYRPQELEEYNLYDFVALSCVKNITRNNADGILRFASKDHQQHKLQGMCMRNNMVTPLISFLDFPNSSEFNGEIMDAGVETNPAMEKYAKTVLCLFVPFRNEEQLSNGIQEQSYVERLREVYSTGALSSDTIE
jgi:hypothetical protein